MQRAGHSICHKEYQLQLPGQAAAAAAADVGIKRVPCNSTAAHVSECFVAMIAEPSAPSPLAVTVYLLLAIAHCFTFASDANTVNHHESKKAAVASRAYCRFAVASVSTSCTVRLQSA